MKTPPTSAASSAASSTTSGLAAVLPSVATGFLGAILVFIAYFPSDSVGVEAGSGLWFAALAISWMTLVLGISRTSLKSQDDAGIASDAWSHVRQTWFIDVAMAGLAIWMMIAALAGSGASDLRMGTNEAWWWVSAAALVIAARRVMVTKGIRSSCLLLLAVIVVGLAADALHEKLVALPAIQAEYRADPDTAIQKMGVDAPPDSSMRMVLENRLFDGGPTATFALANSLAAMLVAGSLIALGVLRYGWRDLSPISRLAWGGGLLVILPALLAVRSRTALVAVIVGVAALGIMTDRDASIRGGVGRSARWLKTWLALAAAGVAGTFALAIFGDPEWFEQAPASLTFRFQYWRATWRMMMDHPLMGAGPGNFQSLYDRYREASTTESIADPHNFLFETLASGGFIALGLLLIVFAAGLRVMRKRSMPEGSGPGESHEAVPAPSGHHVLVGGGLMLVLIWAYGFLTLSLPDFQSHRFAIPVALGFGWSVAGSQASLSDRAVEQILKIILGAMLVHLSVSGGWTIPGVASVVWIVFAGLTRIERADFGRGRWKPVAGLGILILVTLFFLSLRPVNNARWSVTMATSALENRLPAKADRLLSDAVDDDRWAVSPALYRSEFLKQEVIRQNDRDTVRKNYEASIHDVIRRAGENPTVFRQLASQRLHLYQVFGKPSDLDQAQQQMKWAVAWAPSNQWMIAQLAEIEGARGRDDFALELTARAWELSQRGNNIERYFYLQQLYVAEPLGDSSRIAPLRRSASKRLGKYLP